MNKKINVLSLFDGLSCGRIALERANINIGKYYASEIDKYATQISEHNYPDIIRLGDVKNISTQDFNNIDLLIGGSPCQDLSQAMSDRKGLAGKKSSLFFEYLRFFKESKPKYFLFENVGSMAKTDMNIISDLFSIHPIRINSKLVSAALRNRLYWTNIPNIKQPEDKNILLQDILESGYTDRKKARALLSSDSRPLRTKSKMIHRYKNTGFTTLIFDDKEMTDNNCRYMTQIELERCMTLPVGYTQCVKRDIAAGAIGNGWTVDVISHIFKNLKF